MKAANILLTGLMAATLTGCGAWNYTHHMLAARPGDSVAFVSGTATSVLIDFDNSRPGELPYADTMATQKCGIFGKSTATLESLNPREGDTMRATYICK